MDAHFSKKKTPFPAYFLFFFLCLNYICENGEKRAKL